MANGNGSTAAPPRPGGPGGKPPMKKSTRNWLIIGTVGGAGVIIWYIMRAKQQSSQTATDPSIDPATGIPYSQENQGQYGGYGVGGGGSPYLYGYYDPTTGQYVSGSGSGGVVTTPTTNAEWAQQVEAYLQQLGYNPMHVAAALGKYLTGQKLTADQMAIVQAALAFYGKPPQGGAPPPIQWPPNGHKKPPPIPFPPRKNTDITIHRNATLAEIARARGWSNAFLAAVEKMDHLTARSRLKRGQRLRIPAGKVS